MRRSFAIRRLPESRKRRARILLGCLVAALALPSVLAAQSKTGTSIGGFTLIEPSARVAAMGGAGSTFASEAMSGYYNAGAFGALQSSDVQFTYNLWYAGITLNYAVAAVRLNDANTIAASFTELTSGDIAVRTVEQPLGTGEQYSVTDVEMGLAYGLRITDRFTCGVQANYISERIWHSSTSVIGFSFGTLYELSENGLRIGASLMNFGTKNRFTGDDLRIRYDVDPTRYGDNSAVPGQILTDDFSLPSVFRVGLGYSLKLDPTNTLNLAVDALHPSENSESLDLGGEWVFARVLAVRAGYQSLFQTDSEVGLTAGGGVMWDGAGYDIHFDYGWASHKRLGSVHRITLGIGF